jgi:hypothetical protein
MGLLTDFTVKDQKTKRRINMIKTVIIIFALLVSTFIPQIMDLAYQQGKQFANQTCLLTANDLKNTNGSGFRFSNTFYIENESEGDGNG